MSLAPHSSLCRFIYLGCCQCETLSMRDKWQASHQGSSTVSHLFLFVIFCVVLERFYSFVFVSYSGYCTWMEFKKWRETTTTTRDVQSGHQGQHSGSRIKILCLASFYYIFFSFADQSMLFESYEKQQHHQEKKSRRQILVINAPNRFHQWW